MNKTAISLILAASIGGSMLAGCRTQCEAPPAPPPPAGTGWTQGPGKDGVFLLATDIEFQAQLHVTGAPIASFTADGLMKAQVDLYNSDSQPLRIQYKFTWFNADGEVIHAGMRPWQFATIQGAGTAQITAVCTTPGAVKFRVEIDRFHN